MKITFLGTLGGMEPMPGKHHSSFVVERNGKVYWFDTGENCSYAAHLFGIDLMATRAVFLTHRHTDHVGGLPMLVWTIRKINSKSTQSPPPMAGKRIDLLLPTPHIWEATKLFFEGISRMPEIIDTVHMTRPIDGTVFDEDGFKVTAYHNTHVGAPRPGQPWESFSYRFEADGQAVIYSGDIGHPDDIDPLIAQGCDLLLMECGHHSVEEVCEYGRRKLDKKARMALIHHGRAVIADPPGELRKAKAILGERTFYATEGMSLLL